MNQPLFSYDLKLANGGEVEWKKGDEIGGRVLCLLSQPPIIHYPLPNTRHLVVSFQQIMLNWR